MISIRKGFVLALSLALTVAAVTGCKSKKNHPINPELAPTAKAPTAEETTGTGLPELSAEDYVFNKDSGLKAVYFDYDSYALRPDALDTLRADVDILKQYPGVIVQIEGHCDERGTQEYNMALGDKRAQTTREQLVRLGISGDRMITISYGEEAPADPGHDEAAWTKNRRCEFARGQKIK
jgi:peptidoglycan-associated lipoprotein